MFLLKVFVGRPALWGLAVGGQAGVQRMLSILRTELQYAFQIAGKSLFMITTYVDRYFITLLIKFKIVFNENII